MPANLRLTWPLSGHGWADCTVTDHNGQAQLTASYITRAPEDLLNSRTILIWGRNPVVTNIHLLPLLKTARERGATVIVIDPRRTDQAVAACARPDDLVVELAREPVLLPAEQGESLVRRELVDGFQVERLVLELGCRIPASCLELLAHLAGKVRQVCCHC
jgi:hypothetical protein